MDFKEIWFFFNCIFLTSFTFRILGFTKTLSLFPALPNFINCIILVFAYTISIVDIFRKHKKLLQNHNFYCIFLFLTFPNFILLTPFYVLSIYHVNAYIIANKKFYYSQIMRKVTSTINEYSFRIGVFGLHLEIYAAILALIMLTVGKCSVYTVVMYGIVIYQQRCTNTLMKNVFSETVLNLNVLIDKTVGRCGKIINKCLGRNTTEKEILKHEKTE